MESTEHEEHRQIEESLGAYIVGGLDAAETTRIRRHLERCERCRVAVDELEGIHELLESATLAQEPPPEMEERVISAILASSPRSGEPLVLQSGSRSVSSPTPSKRLRTSLSTLGAAAVVIALVAVAVNNQLGKDRPSPEQATSSPTLTTTSHSSAFKLVAAGSQLPASPSLPSVGPSDAPSLPVATSTVREIQRPPSQGSYSALLPGGELLPKQLGSTWQCDITVWGLEPGQLYEVWFKARSGIYSGGSFRVDSPGIHTVTVSTGVGFEELQEIVISAEPDDGNPAPNGEAVLRAEVVKVP